LACTVNRPSVSSVLSLAVTTSAPDSPVNPLR
jgi:hypothetical protein